MGIETSLIAAAIAAVGAVTAAGVNAHATNKASKRNERAALLAAEQNKGPTAQELAQQREKERVNALKGSSLLGGNQSILGGDTPSASSRSSLLGN